MSKPNDERLAVRKTYKLFIGGAFPRSESGRSYVVTDPRTRRSLRSNQQNHSVGRYVATDQATRSVAT